MHATLNRKNCIKILEFYLESIFKMETVNATRCFKMFRNKLPSKRKKGEKKNYYSLLFTHLLQQRTQSRMKKKNVYSTIYPNDTRNLFLWFRIHFVFNFHYKIKKSNFKTLIHHPKWNLVKFLDVGIENRIVWLNKRHKTTTKQMHNKSFSIAVVKWRLPSIVCIQKFLQVLVSCCFFFLLFSFGRRVRRRCFALIFFSKRYGMMRIICVLSSLFRTPTGMRAMNAMNISSMALPHTGCG